MCNFPTESDELRPQSRPRNEGEGFGDNRDSRGREPLAIYPGPVSGPTPMLPGIAVQPGRDLRLKLALVLGDRATLV